LLFLGYKSGLGDIHSGDVTSTSIENIDTVIEKNSIIDDSFLTKDISIFSSPLNKIWDFNTVFHAMFQGNLLAGNVDFVVSQVSSMRVKRREKGTYKWTTLFQVPIAGINDLLFERFDRFCRAETEYEWALVPVINGIEGNLSINSIVSDFDGMAICEKDTTFLTPLDVKYSRQRNRNSSILNSIEGKFPSVIINSQNCYDSGTASGVFIQLNEETCEFDLDGGWKYRDDFLDFLSDGKPKFLKLYNSNAWIISVIDNPAENNDEHPDKVVTSFSWVQVGDINSSQDLYDNGLVDIGIKSL